MDAEGAMGRARACGGGGYLSESWVTVVCAGANFTGVVSTK